MRDCLETDGKTDLEKIMQFSCDLDARWSTANDDLSSPEQRADVVSMAFSKISQHTVCSSRRFSSSLVPGNAAVSMQSKKRVCIYKSRDPGLIGR